MGKTDSCVVKQALGGPGHDCGDTGIVIAESDACFFALVDGLGHGSQAHAAAMQAEGYLHEHHAGDLADLMNGLHEHLKGTRGAVAALCRLNLATGELKHVGIGNITTRVFGSSHLSLISRDGVIGYAMPAPKEQQMTVFPGDLIVLYSDGLREHFVLEDYPGLLDGTARQVATNLMRHLAKQDDDASCITVRYHR